MQVYSEVQEMASQPDLGATYWEVGREESSTAGQSCYSLTSTALIRVNVVRLTTLHWNCSSVQESCLIHLCIRMA